MKIILLIFKQGFKSIFKFKIQFVVVLFLTFLASFYIATSTCLTYRMNQAYKTVMSDYEPFQNTYSKRSNESDMSKSSKTFIPILDLVSTQNNYVKNTSEIVNDSFNLVLNNFGLNEAKGYEQTFITKALFEENNKPTQELEKVWRYNYVGKFFEMWKTLSRVDFSQTGLTLMEYQGTKNRYSAGNKLVDFGIENNRDEINDFAYQIVKMLSISLEEELKSKQPPSSLQSSFIYKYWNTLPSEEKKFESLKEEELISDKKDMYTNFVSQNGQFQVYVYNALESIAFNIIDEAFSFLKNSYTESLNNEKIKNWDWSSNGNNSDEKIKNYIDTFNSNANKNKSIKIFAVNNYHNEQESIRWNMELAFEYLFGTTLDWWLKHSDNPSKEPINKNFIVNNQLPTNDVYAIKVNNAAEATEFSSLNWNTNGLRGVVNPVNINLSDDKNYISNAKARKTSFSNFEMVKSGTSQAKINNGKVNDYKQDPNSTTNFYNWNNIYANNTYHTKMISKISDIDLHIREEAFLYDKTSKRNFRFVILDDDYDYNFKIMAGIPVMQSKEIVISQQFAFKNNYDLGDTLKIGKDVFTISGFGSDVLTYYPLVDPEVPVTDPRSSVILYTPKYVIKDFFKNNPDLAAEMVFTTHFFLNDKINDPLTYQNRLSKYDAYQMYNNKSFARDFERATNDSSEIEYSLNNLKIKNFEMTNFMLNWSLQPKIIKIVNISSIVTSVLVILMAMFTLFFAIKKNIDHNSNQVGYLKAMGVGAYKLSTSYTAYTFIIGLIIIPIAWVTAGLFQEIVSKVFATYFSTTLYQFVFSFKLFVILFLTFGVGAFIVSYLATLLLTRKKVLDIINKENIRKKRFSIKINIMKRRVVNFKFLFPFKIAVRGFNQIIMISITSLLVSIIVTVGISVPSILTIYIRDSSKYFSYQNQYVMDDYVGGIPTAKKSLTASRGYLATNALHEEPNVLTRKNSFGAKVSDIYFDNNKYYTDLIWDSSIMPIITYGDGWKNTQFTKDFNWTEKFILDSAPAKIAKSNDSSNIDTSKVIKLLVPLSGQLGNLNALNLSGGIFEKIASYAWNSDTDPNGVKYFNSQATDTKNVWENKRDTYIANTEYLSTALGLIFNVLLNTDIDLPTEIEKPEDPSDWKRQLISLIGALVPLSGQQYLKDSPNRGTQFSMSINSENYVPMKETLSTETIATYNKNEHNFLNNLGKKQKDDEELKNKSISLTGMKSNQSAYVLTDQQKDKVFIQDSEIITKLNNLFNEKENYTSGDIIWNDTIIYNSKTKSLNVPVVSNLKKYSQHKLNTPLSINGVANQILSVGDVIIPNKAWVYDNRDITKNLKVIDPNNQLKLKKQDWINPESIDPNKYIYSKQLEYDDQNGDVKSINNESKWFINSYFQNNKTDIDSLSYEFRPYYSYNNLKLFIPRTNEIDMGALLNGPNSTERKSKFAANDWRSNKDIWHGTVSSYDVPEQVIKAWGNEYKNYDWEWIAPYNISYSRDRKMTDPSFIDGNNIVESIVFIYNWAGDKVRESGDYSYAVIKSQNNLPSFLNEVNLFNVASVDTYNGDFTIVDQDLLNLLTNKSTEKYIPVDYDYYGDPIKEIPDGKIIYEDHEVTVRNMKTPMELLNDISINNNFFLKEELKKNYLLTDDQALLKVIQNRDFNNKYSGFVETYGMTSAARIYAKDSKGIWPIEDSERLLESSLGSIYNSVDLLGTKLGVITSVSETILLISIFLISSLVVISMLIILVIADIYIMKYHKFIITMKALGYGKTSIIVNSVLIPAIITNILVVIGYFLGKYLIGNGLIMMTNFGIYIPLVVHPWVPLLVMTGMFMLFSIGYIISLKKPMTDKLTALT